MAMLTRPVTRERRGRPLKDRSVMVALWNSGMAPEEIAPVVHLSPATVDAVLRKIQREERRAAAAQN